VSRLSFNFLFVGFWTRRLTSSAPSSSFLRCAFASFGGIFFGYDSGYINGVLSSKEFIRSIAGNADAISSSHTSLIVSILSAGTFFGALIAGDLADMMGRRPTIIAGCGIVSFTFLFPSSLDISRPFLSISFAQIADST